MHYLWWHISGADGGVWAFLWGGILSVFVPYLFMYAAFRIHANCHVKGCWRAGHAHEHVVRCKKHLKHPVDQA